ncbi:MAG: gamma-butyrobetaine hydroxylase-like domain-containing protein [Porticoccaceae bacterium]
MPVPARIVVSEDKDSLSLEYPGDVRFNLPAEYLRVYSPSAEVRGHGRGQEVLQVGKRQVKIAAMQQSGNYAVQITFDDGHDSGIYTWDYLFELGSNQNHNWADYLQRLHDANESRDPDTQVVRLS